jgi:serine/threonine protein kinase
MALAPGTRLGSYEIITAIGAGGMGEVYRVRDHRLGRDVALKIIVPQAFAQDPDRLARFERADNMASPPFSANADLTKFVVVETPFADGQRFQVLTGWK